MVRLCRQPDGFSAVRGAYRFLSLLGDEILEIAEDHILTKQKENYQLLMWNYCDYTEAFAKGDRSSLSLLDRDGAFDAKPARVCKCAASRALPANGVYARQKHIGVSQLGAYGRADLRVLPLAGMLVRYFEAREF